MGCVRAAMLPSDLIRGGDKNWQGFWIFQQWKYMGGGKSRWRNIGSCYG